MRKTLIISLLFLFLIISGFFISTNQVKATNYEWIQNGSFESAIANVLLNPSFEIGNGKTYWSFTTCDITQDYAYSGLNSTYFNTLSSILSNSQFIQNVSTNDDNSLNFFYRCHASLTSMTLRFTFSYVEGGTSSVDIVFLQNTNMSSLSWTSVNIMNFISLTVDKTVYKIEITNTAKSGTYSMYVDNFYFGLTIPNGQTDFTEDTIPWWSTQDYLYTGINYLLGYIGQCSAFIGYGDSKGSIIQDIDYLDSDKVSGLTMYAYKNYAVDVGVKVNLIYSDRSYSSKIILVTTSNNWQLLNFSGFVLPNKSIIQIQLLLDDIYPTYVNLDSVSLLATVDVNTHSFIWNVYPDGITKNTWGFSQYQSVTTLYTCQVFNDTGNLAGDGTYTVSTNKEHLTGIIMNGLFSFTLSARNYLMDNTEQIIISYTCDNGNNSGTVNITAQWIYAGGSGGGGNDEQEMMNRLNLIINFIIYFCVYFVPALTIVGITHDKLDPVIGLISGLILSSLVGWLLGLGIFPLIICIFAIGVLFFGKSRGYV